MSGPPRKCTGTTADGDPCNGPAVRGSEPALCRIHGGVKHGGTPVVSARYSKWIREGKLAEMYEASSGDPQLMSMRRPVAVSDALVKRAAELAEERDTPAFREEAKRLMREVRESDNQEAALRRLEAHLRAGAAEEAAYDQVAKRNAELLNSQERCWRIALLAQNAINSQHLRAIFGRLCDLAQMTLPRGSKETPVMVEEDLAEKLIGLIHSEILAYKNGAPLLE